MPFQIITGDITRLEVDAIVNAANTSLLGGGGVDGAIHRAAGPKLLEECRTLHGCEVGQAKVTGGYNLPARYVIHTVGPIWHGGEHGEEALLTSAYRNSLMLAAEKECESVAFPMISAGVYGYPFDKALRVATETIRAFLQDHEMQVYLVIFSRSSFRFDDGIYSDLSSYMRANLEEEGPKNSFFGNIAKSIAFGGTTGKRDSVFGGGHGMKKEARAAEPMKEEPLEEAMEECAEARADEDVLCDVERPRREGPAVAGAAMAQAGMLSAPTHAQNMSLQQALENLDESFSQALLRMIDERGMKDSECYKKANIDRKLFSKIRSDVHYRPSKQTVLAFAVALELSLAETESFLKKAGYALSHASKSDIIVEFFINNGNYDLYTINEALYAFDQSLLGA